MEIVLDNIIFSHQRAGGISAYWYEILWRLVRDQITFKVIEHPRAITNIFRSQINIDPANIIVENYLPPRLLRYLPYPTTVRNTQTIYHSSFYRRPQKLSVPNVTTVHDFTYEKFRRGLPRMVHSWQKGAAIRAATGIICVSENTKQDLLSYYPDIPDSRVRVIYHGASSVFEPIDNADLSFLPAAYRNEPFVLFVGSRSHYKNFFLAVDAVAATQQFNLVSVGGDPLSENERRVLDKRLGKRHCHIPLLSSHDLNALYNKAHALIYPSSYEGFGIPILEAMAAGCPVIAANVSAIPEACGDAALLVNETQPELFTRQILRLENANFRDEIIRKGHTQAGRFSWEKCYQETMAFYQSIWEERNEKKT